MNSNTFRNVHVYDGRLRDIFKPLHIYTKEEKLILFAILHSKLSNPHSLQMLKMIANDIQNNNNYQPENDLDASDILADLINKEELSCCLINSIEEQLSDMRQLGVCPSGRCSRLLQLWSAYKENN